MLASEIMLPTLLMQTIPYPTSHLEKLKQLRIHPQQTLIYRQTGIILKNICVLAVNGKEE